MSDIEERIAALEAILDEQQLTSFIVILHSDTFDGLQGQLDTWLEAHENVRIESIQYQAGAKYLSVLLYYREAA